MTSRLELVKIMPDGRIVLKGSPFGRFILDSEWNDDGWVIVQDYLCD